MTYAADNLRHGPAFETWLSLRNRTPACFQSPFAAAAHECLLLHNHKAMKAIKMSGSVMVPRCRRSLSTLPSTLQELPLDPAYLRRYRDYHSYDLLWSPRPVSRPNRRKRVQAQEVEEPRETKRSLSPPRGTPSHSRRHASTTAAVPLHSSTIIETRPQKRDLGACSLA
jgi:hypothetical protein